jgi:hypothetical protein
MGKLLRYGTWASGRLYYVVGFEENRPDRYLTFAQRNEDAGKPDAKLYLTHYEIINGRYLIKYGDAIYVRTNSNGVLATINENVRGSLYGNSKESPHLIIKGIKTKNEKEQYHKASGWKVNK